MAERVGRRLDDAGERGVEAGQQRAEQVARHLAGLLPAAAQAPHPLQQGVDRPVGDLRGQRLGVGDQRLAPGHAVGERLRVAGAIALHERVARGAEPLPHRFRLRLLHRADGLPLGLERLQLGEAGLPVGGRGQRLGARDERLLLLQVRRPERAALLQIVLPAGEEAVARGAEALPDGLLVAARRRADRLPLGLQRLQRVGGGNPVGRIGQRLGLLAQRDLAREIAGLLRRHLGAHRLQPLAHRLHRRAEPVPERLGAIARRGRHGLPLGLQLAHAAQRDVRVRLAGERLHLRDELLLHAGVRPAAPVVGFAQLVGARLQRRARRGQLLAELLPLGVAAGLLIQLRLRRDRFRQRAIERLQRRGLELLQIGEPLERLLRPPLPLLGLGVLQLAPRRLACFERLVGRLDAGDDLLPGGILLQRRDGRAGFLADAPRALPQLARPRELLVGGHRLQRRRQLAGAADAVPQRADLAPAPLEPPQRRLEVGLQLPHLRMVDDGQRVPLCLDGGFGVGGRLARQRAHAVDHRAPLRQLRLRLARLPFALGALLVRPLERVARGLERRLELRERVRVRVDAVFAPPRFERRQPLPRPGLAGCRRERLDLADDVALCPAPGFDRRHPGRLRGCRRRFLFLDRAQHRPRAPRRCLIHAPRRHRPQRRRIGHPLQRAEGRLAETALERRRGQLAGVDERRQRRFADRRVLRPPGDRSERPLIAAEALERRAADRLPPCRLGDQHELLLRSRLRERAERVERGQAGRLVGLVRPQRDVHQHAGCLIAHFGVRIVAHDVAQHGDDPQLADGRPPHARVLIGPRDLGEHVLLVFRKLLHPGQPCGRIRVLPFRLRLETIENAHAGPFSVHRAAGFDVRNLTQQPTPVAASGDECSGRLAARSWQWPAGGSDLRRAAGQRWPPASPLLHTDRLPGLPAASRQPPAARLTCPAVRLHNA